MYIVVKRHSDPYLWIQNPEIHVIENEYHIPPCAVQTDKNGKNYIWIESKKCFADKKYINIQTENDTITAVSGLEKGEKVLVFHCSE